MQLRPGYPWLLISGYFVAMFLVGSASVSLARSLVANAMQDMQQTTFPIERSLDSSRGLVPVPQARDCSAPWQPAPHSYRDDSTGGAAGTRRKWTLRNRLICPDPQAYFRPPLNR